MTCLRKISFPNGELFFGRLEVFLVSLVGRLNFDLLLVPEFDGFLVLSEVEVSRSEARESLSILWVQLNSLFAVGDCLSVFSNVSVCGGPKGERYKNI